MSLSRLLCPGPVLAVALVVTAASACGGAKPAPMEMWTDAKVEPIVEVAPRLYLVPGGGCNTAVFVASAGVVIVDSKYPANWDDLVAQIRTVTDKPITHVINTHFHSDHAGANPILPATAQVVGHQNAVRRMEEHDLLPRGADGNFRPTSSYSTHLTLLSGDDAIDLYHFGPAHTDGDSLVVFRQARVMHSGDVFPRKMYPIINLEGGGDGVSFPKVLTQAASTIKDVDRIITGHGAVASWSDLREYADFMQTVVDYVRAEMRMGVDKAQVFRAFNLPARFEGYDRTRFFETMDEIDRSIRPRWQRMF